MAIIAWKINFHSLYIHPTKALSITPGSVFVNNLHFSSHSLSK
ncbi:hypothetical protein RINTHH_6360 [Richelia intracellularis HH01]|uniref:Uncharacterized protein n=1 Tax=Richelia intracellularis HH01 TaxID=1165094 RepID=M1X4W3_9NOST|nr:hypothetical protein RINTHH_6360 [Richelia intracellularis HH01]